MNTGNKLEQHMILFYKSLSEKDRRRYAAIEAEREGYGGATYISTLFHCDEKTIRKGISEFSDEEAMSRERIRAGGGGRNAKIEKIENINAIFLDILSEHTAGNPMKKEVRWTNLTKAEIIRAMAKRGIKVSKNIVRKLLKKNKFVKRKAQKSTATTDHADRDQQFKKISKAKEEYE